MRGAKLLPRAVLCAVALFTTALTPAPAWATPGEQGGLQPEIEQLYNAGRYRQAAEALEAAAQQSPQNASLRYWLGRCFYELGDYNRASSNLELAVMLAPNQSEYHDWLGKAFGRKAEESSPFSPFSGLSLAHKTHREFEAAVRLDATNLEAQRDLIRFLFNAPGIAGGGEDHALEQIRALSAVDPIEGQLAQAEYFASRKKLDQAADEYKKVIAAKPQHVGVYFEIAEYYRDRGDGEEMNRIVEAGSKLAPFDPRLGYYRGVAWALMKKNLDGAETNLRAYLASVPDSAEAPPHVSAHEWLAKVYEEEAKPDQAVEEYRAVLTLDPHNKVAHDSLKRLQKQ
jgi:tetratricopeptide (TPR) repeat protein